MPRRTIVQSSTEPQQEPQHPPLTHVRSLLAKAQALSARLAALSEVAVAIQGELDSDAVLKTFAREARWVLDFHYCSVSLWDGTTLSERVLRAVTSETNAPDSYPETAAIPRSLRSGQAMLIRNATPDDALPLGMRSAIILPLRNQQELIGTVNFLSQDIEAYSSDDLRIAYALAMQVAVVLQNARLLRAAKIAHEELITVLESISDGVLVLDGDARIVLLNTAFRQLMALPDASSEGQRAIRLLRRAQAFERSGSRVALLQTFRAQWRTAGGGKIQIGPQHWLEWAVAPFVDGTDGFVITVRDISQQIELEHLRDTLAGMLVHDLRTPLTSIIMGLDMMRLYMDQGQFADVREVIQHNSVASRRLLSLVNTILDVRKLQAGHLVLHTVPVSVGVIAEQAAKSVEYQARRYGLSLDLAMPEQHRQLLADAEFIQRVLENLLSNAIKFSPSGTTIVLAAVERHDEIEMSVCDAGPGVPLAEQELIFEMYGQASSDEAHRGTGLGLTFCRLVVEAHGGAIGVRPRSEGGSEFWFTLPLQRHDPA